MTSRLAVLAAGVLALSSAAHAQSTPDTTAAAEAKPRPSLVVFITVDQMRPEYFTRWPGQLQGGLARLLRGGAFFENGYQDHAITETAPGHSVVMSGRFPRSTGITMNSLGVQDSLAPMIGGGGPGASPARFRGTVLADWMRAADPRSRALSVSRKDRGAILPLGRSRQEEVYWYAPDGRFTTSTYYHDTLPTWVQQFNARKLPQSYTGSQWTLLRPDTDYKERDTVDVENGGQLYVFPHVFPADSATTARLLAAYPMMDEVTLKMALAGVEAMKLGTGPQTDVLAVSLSTTDAIGHAFGPDSREIHDQILRLDRYLGVFLDSLFRIRDSSRIVIALTADHGVAPYPELHAQETGEPARFADIAPTISNIMSGLVARGASVEAIRVDEGIISVDRAALAAARLNADSILRVLADSLKHVAGVQRVDRVKQLASRDTTKDYVARRWLHMLPPDVPADLVITLVPYAYWHGVTYATHGTPHDYDARVPVLFFGPMIKPGRYRDTVRVVDMAPTLARIVGVRPLERLDGRVLTQILR